MLQFLLPAAVSAGASLIGGAMNQSNQQEAIDYQREQRAHNEALQREFAQNSIQWKVKDAQAAGVHPLAALGAPSISPAVSIGSLPSGNSPMGSALASAGQDISRAMTASATQTQRDGAQSLAQNLLLERGALENEVLRAQLARLRSAQVGPGAPSAAEDPWKAGVPLNDANDASRVTNDPVKVNPGAALEPGSGPGAHSDVDWVRTRNGGLTAAPSKAMKDRVEDMGFEPHLWTWRNRVMPYITGMKPPPVSPPHGKRWEFSHHDQTWYPVPLDMGRGGGGGY